MAQLCQHQDELRQLNTEVILLSFGTAPGARDWSEETCASFRLLLDPRRDVYRSYGLQRSWRRSWNLKTLWRYLQLMAVGRRWRGIQGDSTQLGGDIVVDRNGIVQLAYRSQDPTDRPPVDDLLGLLRRLNEGDGRKPPRGDRANHRAHKRSRGEER